MAKKKLKITDQIQSYLDACKYNGKQPIDREALLALGFTTKQIAGIELEEITLALNEGKPTDIYNGELRYYPVFWTYQGPSGFAFRYSRCATTYATAGSGSRLRVLSEIAADHIGRTFPEVWEAVQLK